MIIYFYRSRMVVAAFTGNYVGIVVSLPVSGILGMSLIFKKNIINM